MKKIYTKDLIYNPIKDEGLEIAKKNGLIKDYEITAINLITQEMEMNIILNSTINYISSNLHFKIKEQSNESTKK